jgi:hypothetical protein
MHDILLLKNSNNILINLVSIFFKTYLLIVLNEDSSFNNFIVSIKTKKKLYFIYHKCIFVIKYLKE